MTLPEGLGETEREEGEEGEAVGGTDFVAVAKEEEERVREGLDEVE